MKKKDGDKNKVEGRKEKNKEREKGREDEEEMEIKIIEDREYIERAKKWELKEGRQITHKNNERKRELKKREKTKLKKYVYK